MRACTQDDAMVVGIMEAERKEIARERKRRQSAARRIRRVGKARPPGPPSEEAGANGSLYVGRGLGIRKEAPKNENGGSVRSTALALLLSRPAAHTHAHLTHTRHTPCCCWS